ncbi:hypothetical protein M433DRAFT_72802 [Acidomyces richmondensis BFW]|nr:MAG: hypothetical protein FE78DRAFT_156233 [Acidomyces sp. 'richmondensis']KYG42929.1 hypothetical protein M433DRAFT_72802 [Acidomyces richmondensis BFW]
MLFRCAVPIFCCWLTLVSAKCYDPFPGFPVPLWQDGSNALSPTFATIAKKLDVLARDKKFENSSFSIDLTSNSETLWSYYHTARRHNKTRPGVTHVDGDSQYRIASISKTFTTLALLYQHEAGNLSLDDPVDKYIPELAAKEYNSLPWHDITLRIMASQLSGIPRESFQADLINQFPDPTKVGLPPADREGLPTCWEYNNYKFCDRDDLLAAVKTRSPIFAPNQKSTYSNANFELLGLVVENVTGLKFKEYIQQAIFESLNMTLSTMDVPPDDHAVLPLGQWFWDVDQAVRNPTGGIYSSANDMSKYVRYILTHYNALATGVNWMLPASWSNGMENFYGMPWEIFRTDRILKESHRPVTFVTKSGGVPSYFSRISIMPEYGLGLTILTAGDSSLLGKLQELVSVEVVRAAEDLVWKDIDQVYSGKYISTNSSINSSLELITSPATGLTLKSFISNATDVFAAIWAPFAKYADTGPWHAQLMPTLLYKNESTQQGEIWRVVIARERQEGENEAIWDDFCIEDVDANGYAGFPLNEIVFWHEDEIVELTAFKVKMKRFIEKDVVTEKTENKMIVQLP